MNFNDLISAKVVDTVNSSSVLLARLAGKRLGWHARRPEPYKPPEYTDLRPWMALNYLVLGCMATLVGALIWLLTGA